MQSAATRPIQLQIDSRIEPIEQVEPVDPLMFEPIDPLVEPEPLLTADLDEQVIVEVRQALTRRETTPLPSEMMEPRPERELLEVASARETRPHREAPTSPQRANPEEAPRIQREPVAVVRATEVLPNEKITSVEPPATASSEPAGAKVDELPRPLPQNPHPEYPLDLRRRQIGGRVLLRVLVQADGRVARVEIQRSSGHAALDESAVSAVRRWRFAAATTEGRPIDHEVLLPVAFSIRGSAQ
jgi:protein TonB